MSKPLTTPRGTAIYPWLERPDTKFNKAGTYRVKLLLEGEDAEELKDAIDAAMEASLEAARDEVSVKYAGKKSLKAKLKKVKLADVPYAESEDEDGWEFNFKMTASGVRKDKSKWKAKPVIIDGKGAPVTKELKIGGGSIIRVSYFINSFYTALVGAGISLRLNAVQVLKLVSWGSGGGDAEYHGFEAEDDGFDADTVAESDDDDDDDEAPEYDGDDDDDDGPGEVPDDDDDDDDDPKDF